MAVDLGSWLRCSVDSLAEQAGVAVGLIDPQEVALDSEVPLSELERRFHSEANQLKDGPNDVSTWFCGPPDGMAGPSRTHIDRTLARWTKRLSSDGRGGQAAVEALLRSKALSIAFGTLARCKAGREVLHSAARDLQSREPSEPLSLVLTRASGEPAAVLGKLLALLAASAEALGRMTELHIGPGTPAELERLLQWCAILVEAATRDPDEAKLLDQGKPVLAFETAQAALAEDAPQGFDQQLNATESLDRSFRDLRDICTQLAQAAAAGVRASKPPKVNGSAADGLKATVSSVLALRAEQEAKPPAAQELADHQAQIVAASLELEGRLLERQEIARKLIANIPDFPGRRQEVMSTCLQCESLRRQRFVELLEDMQRLLWDAGSFVEFAHNPEQIPVIREVIKRASGLVDQAWRDMVGVAAEALDDDNPIGAKSEDMSGAANQYKGMRQDLAKNMGRLGKLEEKAAEGPPPSPPPAPKAKAAPVAKVAGAAASPPQPRTTAPAEPARSATTTESSPAQPACAAPRAPTPPSSPPACKADAAGPGDAAPAEKAPVATAVASTAAAVTQSLTSASASPEEPALAFPRMPSVGTWLVVRLQPPPEPVTLPKGDAPEPVKTPKESAAASVSCKVEEPSSPQAEFLEPVKPSEAGAAEPRSPAEDFPEPIKPTAPAAAQEAAPEEAVPEQAACDESPPEEAAPEKAAAAEASPEEAESAPEKAAPAPEPAEEAAPEAAKVAPESTGAAATLPEEAKAEASPEAVGAPAAAEAAEQAAREEVFS